MLMMRQALTSLAVILPMLAANASAADLGEVSAAVNACVGAITKTGVDDQPFLRGGWATEVLDGMSSDRFYSKSDLRASLGLRPDVGGSCIISFSSHEPYNLTMLTASLAQKLQAKASAKGSEFAIITVADKVVIEKVTSSATGYVVSIDVEMLDR